MKQVNFKRFLKDAEFGRRTLFVYKNLELVEVVKDEQPEGYDMPEYTVYLIKHPKYGTKDTFTPVENNNNNTEFYILLEHDNF